MLADGDDFKVGPSALDGVTAIARVVGHERGPKIDVLRYKAKKRVRVHRGARAELSALEIVEIGGKGRPKPKEATTEAADAKAEKRGARTRSRKTEPTPEAVARAETEAPPARTRRRRPAKAGEDEDGS